VCGEVANSPKRFRAFRQPRARRGVPSWLKNFRGPRRYSVSTVVNLKLPARKDLAILAMLTKYAEIKGVFAKNRTWQCCPKTWQSCLHLATLNFIPNHKKRVFHMLNHCGAKFFQKIIELMHASPVQRADLDGAGQVNNHAPSRSFIRGSAGFPDGGILT